MSAERYLITGALGCIGTWVVRQLVREGSHVTTLDLDADPYRWRQIMTPAEIAEVHQVHADIADLAALERVIDAQALTRIIHLAALQVPACRADPPLGARVNVGGTVNVLEAARRRREQIPHVVYASSVAAYDALERPGDAASMVGVPATLYGVFKRANEGTAQLYWADYGLASVGIRPYTVFGPGRDQGLTSAPTQAMLAAAAGVPFRIPFGGASQFQYAPDVAGAFVAAARVKAVGAAVYNLAGSNVHMRDVVAAIGRAAPDAAGSIDFDDLVLPFPTGVDARPLEPALGPIPDTPFADAVRETIETFKRLIADGTVDLTAVGASPS